MIRDLVISAELLPGQKLSEAAFSDRFEVSRNTLREAFRLLTKDGLLKHENNRGVFVATPTTANILDIYRVRRMVECGAIRQAWHRHPALGAMRRAVDLARSHIERAEWREVGSANMEFHAAIVDLSDSPKLNEFYKRISAELRLGFSLLPNPESFHSPFVDMNESIMLMIESARIDDACQAMSTYLDVSERTVLKAFVDA